MHLPGLPDKTYYKIGEVARIAEVKTSVLRFWETEFPFVAPEKSGSGQRLYRQEDIVRILQIKDLLYKEKFTIEGVRKRLGSKGQVVSAPQPDFTRQILAEIRDDLLSLQAFLKKP